MKWPHPAGRKGFTLAEMLISTAVSSIIFAGFFVGVGSLRRSFSAAEFYSMAQGDQSRVMDYVVRDVRRALTMSVSGSTTLNLTVPTYIVSGSAVTPTLSSGSVVYSATNTTIAYALNGSTIRRTENGGTALVIANNVASFAPVIDTADATGKTLITTVTFAPNFKTATSTDSTAGTTVSCRAAMRN